MWKKRHHPTRKCADFHAVFLYERTCPTFSEEIADDYARQDLRRGAIKSGGCQSDICARLFGCNPKFSASRIEINHETSLFFRARSHLKIRERPEGTQF
jgi:hypothetical protein